MGHGANQEKVSTAGRGGGKRQERPAPGRVVYRAQAQCQPGYVVGHVLLLFPRRAGHRIRQLLGRVVRVSHELRAQPGGARSQRAIAHQHSGIAGGKAQQLPAARHAAENADGKRVAAVNGGLTVP